jgi:tetratricopeptide (TPR) repeat protein
VSPEHSPHLRSFSIRNIGGCVVLFLTLFASSSAHGQWIEDPTIDARVQRGIDYIYNIEFEKADKEFAEVVQLAPDHPAGYFFQAMTEWWRILSNFDDESRDKNFYDMLEKVVDMCDKRLEKNENDVTALFFKGGAVGFRGRLRANRGAWLAAANDGLVALPAVRKAFKLEPTNYDVLLGMGIYNYYADVVPSQYPIVKPLMIFLPGGDKKKGLEQLELAAQKARYAKTEAMYFLLQTYFSYEKQFVRALEIARELRNKYPRNPLFHRMVGRCYVSLGYWAEAVKIFSEVEERYRNHQVGYDDYDGREAYYYIGRQYFLAGQFDESLKNLYRCDELSRKIDKNGASGFMSMANLTIGMVYDLQKKRGSALAQYQKVLLMKEYENTYKEARRFMERPYTRAQ